jgi:hypothetical protein
LTLNGWVWAVNPRVWPPYKDWILIPWSYIILDFSNPSPIT